MRGAAGLHWLRGLQLRLLRKSRGAAQTKQEEHVRMKPCDKSHT